MRTWTADALRQAFLAFFRDRGHAVIPSASLIPEHDPSVLFTTAGMHPLVPYLMGQVHPAGTRLVDVQKCVRTGDIDEVGDATHLTFFEMLGNWSLGDYGKEDAIRWSFEFLTSKTWLGLPVERLAVSVFAGDGDSPRDEASASVWRELGIAAPRIAYLNKDENWWPAGGKHPGPQGPDTEIFVWMGDGAAPEAFTPGDAHWVEIWNNVFMQFHRTAEGVYEPLAQQNVDTGMGLERMLTVLEGKRHVYETDLFRPIIAAIDALAPSPQEHQQDPQAARLRRLVADHLRAATFILGDPFGVAPSNVDQGYVLRKLIRRAVRAGKQLGIAETTWTPRIAEVIVDHYRAAYPELEANRSRITFELREEEERFLTVLERGTHHFGKLVAALPDGSRAISGDAAFTLYESFGFPLEVMQDLAREHSPPLTVDREAFERAAAAHAAESRASTGQRFQGGLADHSDQSIRYHTATHLLHQALRNVLGDHIAQRGSNITPERMRFDFAHPEKLTEEQCRAVERMVQEQIARDLPVSYELLDPATAKARGALGFFDDMYAELGGKMKVYTVGDPDGQFFSKEICGGPHVARTGMLGTFRIAKEEAVARGVRRIRAVVASSTEPITIADVRS